MPLQWVIALLFTVSVAWAHDDPNDPNHTHPAPADAIATTPAALDLYKTQVPVVIDGKLDDPCWQNATPIPVDFVGSKTGVKSETPRMIVKYTWDDQYLTIGYETFDQNLIALAKDDWQGPPNNRRQGLEIYDSKTGIKVDVVEFFLSFGDEHCFWELHHNAHNQFNDILCVAADPAWPISKTTMSSHGIIFLTQEFVADDGANTVAMAVQMKPKADGKPSTVNDSTDVDTGYTGEIRLPWRSIGVPASAVTWIQNVKPAPRTPGPFKMDGLTVSLLAVCQDGDLKDRYHHSSAIEKPGWFHLNEPAWPVYRFVNGPGPAPALDASPTPAVNVQLPALPAPVAPPAAASGGGHEETDRAIVERLVRQADAGEPAALLAQTVGERGIAAALLCAENLDEQKPQRSEFLYQAIAFAANCRRAHPEILRLYQPEAYSLFHTADGFAGQRGLAAGLEWKAWPASLPGAVVRAAPLPTLEWLRKQAAVPNPPLDKLRLLLPPLGWWLRTQNEHQFPQQFHQAAAALAANAAIAGDPAACAALLQLIADANASESLGFVLQQCLAPRADVRATAVAALGRVLTPHTHGLAPARGAYLASLYRRGASEPGSPEPRPAAAATGELLTVPQVRERALPDFLRLAHEETELPVLVKLAAAAEGWPDEPQVGQAMLDLFARCNDPDVRRGILYSALPTRWPQQSQLLLRAFDSPDNGVLGVALQGIAAHPGPEMADAILGLVNAAKDAQTLLIDAAGALGDERALPRLLAWLQSEHNVAVRLKLALALEKIPGQTSGRALTDLLAHDAEPLLVEHACRIASRRELPGAATPLATLAEDSTAPLNIRGQAVWALGRYTAADPAARASLDRMSRDPAKYFAIPGGQAAASETLEQARMFLALARLRAGDPGAEDELTQRFRGGVPAAQLTCLLALTEIKRDHPVIAAGLASSDFASLVGAVRAADAADPAKYLAQLRTLRQAPFIATLLESGLDTWRLPDVLPLAIRDGEAATQKGAGAQ